MKRLYIWLLGLFFFTLSIYAEPHGYAPIIRNDLNTSAYDWNAFNTRWVNMRVLAMVGIDTAHFDQDRNSMLQIGDMSHYDRWDVRGLRIGAGGTINFERPWTYLVSGSINTAMQDYDKTTDDAFTLLDCLIGIPLWGEYGRMQIGKMKAPISMERVMGMVFEQVMERPMHLDALLPSRNTGISLSDMLLNGRLRWRAGIYNDWLESDGRDFQEANYLIAGRVTGLPYVNDEEKSLLHLGVAYRYEKLREGEVRYNVGPEFYFDDSWLDTGSIAADSSQTLNAELTWLSGPLWIASEYTATYLKTPHLGTLSFSGYHVAVNYFLTGEHRGYNRRRGTVRRITPVLDFTQGGWGAVEVSARYSALDLNDKSIRGGEMGITSLGLIWHPRRDHQFHLQWSHAHMKEEPLTTPPSTGNTNIFQVRWVWVID